MKKKVAILLAAFMLTGLLAGCGKDTAVGRDVSKYVTVGNYKGVEVTVAPIVPEAAEVEAYALNLYQSSVTAENGGVVDRAVALGDTANIDYVGKKDGVAFDGGTDSGYNLGIGSGSFIEGFEEGLVGVKPGETVDLNLTFPENYGSADLAGQKVVFTVTVNYIIPGAADMKDEVVAGFQNEEYSNMAELNQYANDVVEEYYDAQYQASVEGALMMEIMNQSVFNEVPEEDVEKYREIISAELLLYAQYYQIDIDTLAMYMYGADIATTSQEFAKQALIIQAIANAESLNVSDKELKENLNEDAKEAGFTVEEYLGGATEEDYRESLMTRKVLDFITKNAAVKAE